jgi:hypothetical protein
MGLKVRVIKGGRPSKGRATPDLAKLVQELQKLRDKVRSAEAAYLGKRRARLPTGSMRK